jgi:hypothetical protein
MAAVPSTIGIEDDNPVIALNEVPVTVPANAADVAVSVAAKIPPAVMPTVLRPTRYKPVLALSAKLRDGLAADPSLRLILDTTDTVWARFTFTPSHEIMKY